MKQRIRFSFDAWLVLFFSWSSYRFDQIQDFVWLISAFCFSMKESSYHSGLLVFFFLFLLLLLSYSHGSAAVSEPLYGFWLVLVGFHTFVIDTSHNSYILIHFHFSERYVGIPVTLRLSPQGLTAARWLWKNLPPWRRSKMPSKSYYTARLMDTQGKSVTSFFFLTQFSSFFVIWSLVSP